MIKIRLWGEPAEIEKLIERICNDLPGVRVLSVSEHYKDRGGERLRALLFRRNVKRARSRSSRRH